MGENGESSHFDSTLGGEINIPEEVNILKYAVARSKEIAAMTECILNPCRTKLVFQALPVHMRRRVMSHRSARLPRRLRAAAEAQARSSGAESQGSRKKRRRPHRLLTLLARRTRKNRWLETHIWHAKRFHMVKRWGYSLPEAPCDKAFRACYRAGSAHCLLQDISYYNLIQISGAMDELIASFKRITSTNCGLSITANAYIKGQREGSAFIYNVDSYPLKCIGKVSFIWRPVEDSIKRCVWIFIHPSFYQKFLNVIIECFKLNKLEQMCVDSNSNKDNAKRKNAKKSENNANMFETFEKYENDNSVTMIEYKSTLNRFRLTGPLSHAVLAQTLTPVEINEANSGGSNKQKKCWFKQFIKRDSNRNTHDTQSLFWKKIANVSSPAELQSRLVLGLNVIDPRMNLPVKRIKAVPNISQTLSAADLINIPADLSASPLWDLNIQKSVSDEKITNFELNKLKQSSNLVPGEISNMYSNFQTIPVIMIQRPGSGDPNYKKIGYGSGWDIIIPSGYGMAFWLAFVLRGARTGGLRETRQMAFECGNLDLHHDTLAGIDESIETETTLREKYFKLPPNKRVNFTKLSINSPFLCRWNTLLNDWKKNTDNINDIFVLRDKNVLKKLQIIVSTGKLSNDCDFNLNCLVPVKLANLGKGKLTNHALICIPNNEDSLKKSIVEPLKKDKNEAERHKMRLAHKTLLKRLRRRSVRRRRKILEKAKKFVKVPKQDNSKLIKDYLLKMHELWLPSDVENVRHQCTREVVGYVTMGDFSFSEAQSSGVGYVALSSIMQLLNKRINNKCLVLTRNTLSRQYRYATLEIITNVLGS